MMNTAAQLTKPINTCTVCKAELTKTNSGIQCDRCALTMRPCVNHHQGCAHIDTDKKCEKHEWFFCQQRTTCSICRKTIPRGSLSAHYTSSHQDITHTTGSTWRATPRVHDFLVTCDAGTAVCQYGLDETQFAMYLSVPVTSEQLSGFSCVVNISNPDTGYKRTVAPQIEHIYLNDWRVIVNKHECPSWNTSFDVCVNINRLET